MVNLGWAYKIINIKKNIYFYQMKENKDVSPTTYEVAIPQERQYI